MLQGGHRGRRHGCGALSLSKLRDDAPWDEKDAPYGSPARWGARPMDPGATGDTPLLEQIESLVVNVFFF